MKKPIFLGVNVDHVATLRQARLTRYPSPVYAAFEAEAAGADGITIHLREDRRHIQEIDVLHMKETLNTRMNLECAITDEMIGFAKKVKPEHTCLVPEKREELTTEGGLDVVSQFDAVKKAVSALQTIDTEVSLFIDPDKAQIDAAIAAGAPVIELHTGAYAEANDAKHQASELIRIEKAARYAYENGLIVNAGHGLHYHNVWDIAAIEVIHELNIGHAIIAEALFCGLKEAVRKMKAIMIEARGYAA